MPQHGIDIKCWHFFKALLLYMRQAIRYCVMPNVTVQGSDSFQRVDPAEAAKCSFWCRKSPQETSFSLGITFYQSANASCFKERELNAVTASDLSSRPEFISKTPVSRLESTCIWCFHKLLRGACSLPSLLLTIFTLLWTIIGKHACCSGEKKNTFTHQQLLRNISVHQVEYAPKGQSVR